MKNKMSLAIILSSVAMIGVLVSLCGIGLSLGMRKLSLISFISVMGLLVLLLLFGRLRGRKSD